MSDLHRFTTPDPCDADGEVELVAEFVVLDFGAEFRSPDIDLRAVRDGLGCDILRRLTPEALALIEEDIVLRFDFAKAGREARV